MGTGAENLLGDPGSELRLGKGKEREKSAKIIDGMSKKYNKTFGSLHCQDWACQAPTDQADIGCTKIRGGKKNESHQEGFPRKGYQNTPGGRGGGGGEGRTHLLLALVI